MLPNYTVLWKNFHQEEPQWLSSRALKCSLSTFSCPPPGSSHGDRWGILLSFGNPDAIVCLGGGWKEVADPRLSSAKTPMSISILFAKANHWLNLMGQEKASGGRKPRLSEAQNSLWVGRLQSFSIVWEFHILSIETNIRTLISHKWLASLAC